MKYIDRKVSNDFLKSTKMVDYISHEDLKSTKRFQDRQY